MKKWKIVNIISFLIIFLSAVVVVYRLIESIVYNVNGWYLAVPGPALFKWYEIFGFNILGYCIYTGPIFLVDILIFTISRHELKKYKSS